MKRVCNTAVDNFYNAIRQTLRQSEALQSLFCMNEKQVEKRLYYDTFPSPPEDQSGYTCEEYRSFLPCVIIPSMGGLATIELTRASTGTWDFVGDITLVFMRLCSNEEVIGAQPTNETFYNWQTNISAVIDDIVADDCKPGAIQVRSVIFDTDYFYRTAVKANTGVVLTALVKLEIGPKWYQQY